MSNEITVNVSLNVNNGQLQYQSRPTNYRADQAVAQGPTPGTILVSTSGTDVDLSQLVTPGLVFLQNLDTPSTTNTNYVTWGMHDPSVGEYIALGELLPGECTVFRLSRTLGTESGTGASGSSTLRLRAVGSVVYCRVDALNK